MNAETPDYRALLDELGYPPIRGGAEDEDASQDQSQEGAPDSQSDQAEVESGTSGEETFHDLDLSRVPEDTDPREWAVKREREMQQAFTRKTQELAEQREAIEAERQQLTSVFTDPEAQKKLLESWGYEVEDDDEGFADEDDDVRRELAELRAEVDRGRQTAEQQAQEQATLAQIGDQLDTLEKQEGRQFSEEETEVLALLALGNPDKQGNPDMDYAYQLFSGVVKTTNGNQPKPQRQRPPGGGVPASRDIDPTDREARIKHAQQVAESVMSSPQ